MEKPENIDYTSGMNITPYSPVTAPKKVESKQIVDTPPVKDPVKEPALDRPELQDQSRVENENGLVLIGPAFHRGDDEVRDSAYFSTESLDAAALLEQG